jgi:prepilin-type N-terminal cleavage/methylation domain-containing protein/prepilin-type processing-associated H-X9-DG protein
MMTGQFKKRSGFTLIELLVVVAIIALLISILLPSLSRAREQAKLVACSSNLKQLGIGVQMYANDWNGVWPRYMLAADNGSYTNANVWTGNGGGNPPSWQGLGRLYSYMNNQKIYYCPNDTFYSAAFLKYDFSLLGTPTPPVGLNPATNIVGSYCVRGWNQPSNTTYTMGGGPPDPYGPPGKTLVELDRRPMACCNMLWVPGTKAPPMWHPELGSFPVLFGDGHVVPIKTPAWVTPGVTPFGPNGNPQFGDCWSWWSSMDIAP